jgi:hypothetical protein
MAGKKEERVPTTLRMSQADARLVGKLQRLRHETSDHAVVYSAFSKGPQDELLDEGIRMYREGMTLEEAARIVGIPFGKLFGQSVVESVTLVEDPRFLEHTADLGRALGIPALTTAAERVLADNLQSA